MTHDRAFVQKQFSLTDETMSKLDLYVSMLNEWQEKMNLVSRTTLPEVWERHILDSAQVFPFLSSEDKTILDMGSGAGFPALVLAVMDEKKAFRIHLAESDGKKCQFLNAVIQACGLNAVVHNERLENMSLPSADVLTARALAPLEKLIRYARPFIGKKTRCIFLKGRKAPEEIQDAEKKWRFQYEKHSSLSSSEGQLLILSGIGKK